MCEVLAAEDDDFFFSSALAFFQGQKGLGPLAPLLVGNGDNGAFHDSRIAAVNLVVMIDASHEGEPGELHIRPIPLPLSAQPSAVGAHYTTPEELAALTAAVYGRCPPVVVVSITGANFSIGEQVSSIVARRISLVSEAVLRVCSNVL